MNALSWFIYFADVLPNVTTAAGFVLFWMIFAIAGATVFRVIAQSLSDKDLGPSKEDAERIRKLSKTLFAWAFVITAISTSLWVLLPSKEALYMIAASEAGETVVSSPEGKEILQDLREVLDAQLQALKTPIITP